MEEMMVLNKKFLPTVWGWLSESCFFSGLCLCGMTALAMWVNPPIDARGERRLAIWQKNRTPDCGAASLYLIGKLTDTPCSLEQLKKLTNTSMLGANMAELKKAAEALGFSVNACGCEYSSLCEHLTTTGHYAILYSLKRKHFISVVGLADGNQVRIADVARGVYDLSSRDIEREYKWDGAALLLSLAQD